MRGTAKTPDLLNFEGANKSKLKEGCGTLEGVGLPRGRGLHGVLPLSARTSRS